MLPLLSSIKRVTIYICMSHELHIGYESRTTHRSHAQNICISPNHLPPQQQKLHSPSSSVSIWVTNYIYMSHEPHMSSKQYESRSTYMSQKHCPRPTTASAPPSSIKSYVSHELRVYESRTTCQFQTTWVTKYTYESQTFTSPNNSSCSPLLWYVSPSSPLIASEAENCVLLPP